MLKITNLFTFSLIILSTSIVFAADYFWVGGSGNWSDINHWATTSNGTTKHAVVPSQNDDVIFNAFSGFVIGGMVNVDVIANCRNMTWNSAPNNPGITSNTINSLNVFGSWTLQPGMSYDIKSTFFLSSSLGKTITTSNVFINGRVTFDGTGGWELMDDFSGVGSSGSFAFNKGRLNTNSHSLTIGGFSSATNDPRTLILGSSIINCSTVGSGWVFTGSNTVLNAGTSRIVIDGSVFRAENGQAYHEILYTNTHLVNGVFQCNPSAGSLTVNKLTFIGNGTVDGNNLFGTLILSPSKKYTFTSGRTQTINLLLDANNPSCVGLLELRSSANSTATLNIGPSATVNISNALIENITASGSIPITANNSFDLTGNNNILFPPAVGKTLYWVGGSGNWNDVNHWSLVNDGVYPPVNGCVPTPIDDVVFNNNSGFTSASRTVNLEGVNHYCHDMNWVGASNNPIFLGGPLNPLSVYGSLTLQNNMAFNVHSTSFLSNDLGETITTNGAFVNGRIIFNGDGSWGFMDNFTGANTANSISLIKGTLNTNSNSITTGTFNSTGILSRTLLLGSSTITCQSVSSPWIYIGTNTFLNAGTSHIIFSGSIDGGIGFKGNNGHTYHHITYLNSNSLVGNFMADPLIGSVTVKKLTFNGNGTISGNNIIDTLYLTSSKKYIFENGRTQQITSLLEANSAPCSGLIELRSSSALPSNLNIGSSAVANVSNALLENIQVSGNIPITATNSFDMGGNTNILFPLGVGKTLYWVGGTGDWNDVNHWSLVNDGVYPPVNGCVPTPMDNVVFNNNSGFTPSSNNVNLTGVNHYCNNMTWIGALNNPFINGSITNPLNVYGSWTLQNGMYYNVETTNFLSANLGNTLTTNGTFVNGVILFNGNGGWEFMDDFSGLITTASITFIKGTLNTNSNNINTGSFVSNSNFSRTLTLGSSEIECSDSPPWVYVGSHATLNAGTSHIIMTNAVGGGASGFNGQDGHVYHHVSSVNSGTLVGGFVANPLNGSLHVQRLTFMGNGTLQGNNMIDTLIFSTGKTYTLYSGHTQTINNRIYASGSPCFITYLQSSTVGVQANLKVLAGSINFDFLNIRNLNATGSYSMLNIGGNSTNAGNNTYFNFAPSSGGSIVGLGADIVAPCPFIPFSLNTNNFFPNPFTEFLWQDSTRLDSLWVTDLGQYSVRVEYGNDCIVHDTILITSVDNTPPLISGCPSNISIGTSPTSCDAVVTWAVPVITDECSVPNVIASHSSGDVFPIGTTTVSYIATDSSGNVSTCSFTITVVEDINPVITDCPSDIILANDTGVCGAVATWTIPTASDNCGISTFNSSHVNGTLFPIGTTVVTYTATDLAGNVSTCSFSVTVNDLEAPIISCPSDLTLMNDPGICGAIATWVTPIASDNCGSPVVLTSHTNGAIFPVGTTTVSYRAIDNSGNSSMCSFTITVVDIENPTISNCPSDIIVTNIIGECSAVGAWGNPVAMDNCGVSSFTSSHSNGSVFPVGVSIVTYEAIDAAGNTATCSFNVTVFDTELPQFVNCPTDIVVASVPGSCNAVVNWMEPSASDNCTIPTVVSSHVNGSIFPIGITNVIYTATDTSGNISICNFSVTVVDHDKPTISGCPADISVMNDNGRCGAIVFWSTIPIATDLCGTATLTSSHTNGGFYPVGTTIVTYYAIDAFGNKDSCFFSINVSDTELPQINIANVSASYCSGDFISWTEQISDNCGIATIVSSHNVGDIFPVGSTSVNYTVTDVNGNIATYSFTVIVNELPSFNLSETSIDICKKTDVTMSISNPKMTDVYTWDFKGVQVATGSSHTILNPQLSDAGVYTITAINQFGCVYDTSLTLKVITCGVVIPESFSPNGDNKNELFFIDGLDDYPNTKIWIHNRWGTLVYQSDDYQNNWDGKSINKLNVNGDDLPESTYFYILELGGSEGQIDTGDIYKGFIYLKR